MSSHTVVKNLFRSDQKIYLFRSFDSSDESQNIIVQNLKPIFYNQNQMQQLPSSQLQI